MRKISRNLTVSALLALGGCSQIIGLSDYEVDSASPGNGGGEAGEGADGGAQSSGGTSPRAGTSSVEAGSPSMVQGGESAGGQGGTAGNQPIGGQGGQAEAGETGAGGEPAIEVPCNSPTCCTQMGGVARGVELLDDGGFEAGPVNEGNAFWTEESTNDLEIITETDPTGTGLGFKSHSGMYYAYLSGLADEESSIYSLDFVVPANAGWMTVSGYRLFQIDTQDATNDDFALIALYDPAATAPEELPFWWGAPPAHPDGWADSPTWKKFELSWDAVPHRGKTRYLGLRGSSDGYSTDPDLDSSSYLFDDVSLKAYRCFK